MINGEIEKILFELQDISYRDFQSKLIPTVSVESFIGVRTPELRALAKEIAQREDKEEFLRDLPHKYFDEYLLHAFVISREKDFAKCISEVELWLPYVDNWAVCDQQSPNIFKKHKPELLVYIKKWLGSDRVYTVRYAIRMLMSLFLDDDFDLSYPTLVAAVRSDEYYINMMIAWYFATALAKQYDSIIPFIENKTLDNWTHNKTIQKSIESRRISPEQKDYLRSLKV